MLEWSCCLKTPSRMKSPSPGVTCCAWVFLLRPPAFPRFKRKPERELSGRERQGISQSEKFLSHFLNMAWKREGKIIPGYLGFLIILKGFYLIWFVWWKYGNVFLPRETKEEKSPKVVSRARRVRGDKETLLQTVERLGFDNCYNNNKKNNTHI